MLMLRRILYCSSLYLLHTEILEGNCRMSIHTLSLITHFIKVHHDVLSHASLSTFRFNISEYYFDTECFVLWFKEEKKSVFAEFAANA